MTEVKHHKSQNFNFKYVVDNSIMNYEKMVFNKHSVKEVRTQRQENNSSFNKH